MKFRISYANTGSGIAKGKRPEGAAVIALSGVEAEGDFIPRGVDRTAAINGRGDRDSRIIKFRGLSTHNQAKHDLSVDTQGDSLICAPSDRIDRNNRRAGRLDAIQ